MTAPLTMYFQDHNSGMQLGINEGTVNVQFNLHEDPLDKLQTVNGAELDSYENQHEDECLLGTRTELLDEIAEWAVSPHGRCILWLNGMAGTGKSTISRTVAKRFKKEKRLGASFFFKRGEGDRGSARKLFPTITRQLTKSIPQLTPSVREAIQNNPDIGGKGMGEQFDKLLLQPLLGLDSYALPVPNMVIVIDALDECEVDNDVQLVLQLLPQLKDSEALRLKVLLTSRPELPIRRKLKKPIKHDYKDLVVHEIPKELVERDLLLFLHHRIPEIKEEREPPLPMDWPGAITIQKLAEMSVPLFLFAATICRIFEDPDWDPLDSLPEILAHQNDESKLESTYLPVLDRLLKRQTETQKANLVQEFHQVVGAIVTLKSPLSVISLSRLLGLPERLIKLRLNPLHSVLRVPKDASLPVHLFHVSFRDFLLDPQTCSKTLFWIHESKMHYTLATRCLYICQSLRKNICGLQSDGTRRTDIDPQTKDKCLPPELQYSCRYWAFHLAQCANSSDIIHDALQFLQEHYLHWVEVMSLLGFVSEVAEMLNLLQKSLPGDQPCAISDFLQDAKRFIVKNRQIANEAPLQIYCAGLIFAPQTSIIRTKFKGNLPTWISQLPRVEEKWSAELQTLEPHSGSILLVTFSPDGRVLASASSDKTVRLWDATTGDLDCILDGHLDSVLSMAFSADGRVLVTGSSDMTVRRWDALTGDLQQIIESHPGSIHSVALSSDGRLFMSGDGYITARLLDTATDVSQQILVDDRDVKGPMVFSPDCQLLACGSSDGKVRLWDITTGAIKRTLKGHLSSVLCVAFSSDGRLLASGSNDDKVILCWDTETGVLKLNLQGDSDFIISVAFSPGGRLIAAGTLGGTVELWDTTTGTLTQTLQGHLGSVFSLAFSLDGRLLATALDYTIRFWDTAVDVMPQTVEGHSGQILSLQFSPNGRLVASGSHDKTVRLWNTTTGSLEKTFTSHSDSVLSVAFSPSGWLLASSSYDQTVKLWDIVTGTLKKTLEGHLSSVQCVAFSPCGCLLASGSFDGTVQLWDTTTGTLKRTLKGHFSSVLLVAFSFDSGLLASSSDDRTSDSGTIRLWDAINGTTQRIIKVGGLIKTLDFSDDGSCLKTNLGSFNILSNCAPRNLAPRLDTVEVSVQDFQWVALDSKKTLWLPHDYRPTCSAVRNMTLALGHASGRISFMCFTSNQVM